MEVVTGNQSWMAGQGKILGYQMMFWRSSWWYVVCGEACMEYENQESPEVSSADALMSLLSLQSLMFRRQACYQMHVSQLAFRPAVHKGDWTELRLYSTDCDYVRAIKRLYLVAQSCPTLWGPMDCSPPGFSVHGDSPGKNTGVDCHALLQGKKAEHWRTDDFELWFWRRLLRAPWTARSNKSILKEINPECSLEGLMLKLKLQYFGHLMWRTDSLEKTLMLGKTEGRRKRGQQRMRWLNGITDSTDMNLSKLK